MSPSTELTFEPSFVENAVFLAMRRYEEFGPKDLVADWHAERNRIYTLGDDQVRDKAFRQMEVQWFRRLGLTSRFDAVLNSFPILRDYSLAIRIRRALARTDEGSELYVQGDRKTHLVKLQPARLFESDFLERFLRHEWLRVSDMLDPAFQYFPHVTLSGASELEDNLIRDRFRILWDLSISVRLMKRGFQNLVPLERQRRLFDKSFSKWTQEMRENMFTEILNGAYQTQSALLEWARDERLMVPLGRGGLLCPLCRFTSFDPLNLSGARDAAMIREIRKDYPGWNLEWGICQHCFDLYQSKMGVAS